MPREARRPLGHVLHFFIIKILLHKSMLENEPGGELIMSRQQTKTNKARKGIDSKSHSFLEWWRRLFQLRCLPDLRYTPVIHSTVPSILLLSHCQVQMSLRIVHGTSKRQLHCLRSVSKRRKKSKDVGVMVRGFGACLSPGSCTLGQYCFDWPLRVVLSLSNSYQFEKLGAATAEWPTVALSARNGKGPLST